MSLPDRSWRWLLLPLPAWVAWLSAVAHEILAGWIDMRPESGIPEGTFTYLATLTLTSIPPWLALIVFLRTVAFIASGAVVLAGSLAVAALTATALALLHRLDASTTTLTWNLGGGGCAGVRTRNYSWTSNVLVGRSAVISKRPGL